MRKSLFLAGLALVAAACATEKVENSVPGKVAIVPVMTRATDVNFENGDAIGVNIVRGDESYAVNNKLTYASDVFSGTLLWYTEAMDKSTVTAYYPYQSAGVPASFSVAADQTAGLSGSDFIAGVKADVTPSINAIVVPFKHMLTKISLEIDNQSQANIASVELRGSKTTADVDLTAMTAVASESSAVETVKAFKVTDNALYSAIVVPQTVAFEMAVTTSTGKELTQKLVSSELKQGMQYTIKVKVLPADIKISISGEIEGWGNGGEIGGDVPAYIDFAEYDGYFIYKNEKYNTVKLSDGSVWMAQPMRYVPEGYTVSTDIADKTAHIWAPYKVLADKTGEFENVESAINERGYLYDLAAAFGVSEITEANASSFEGKQGICPNGWHVPTYADYFALCGAANGATDNADALFYDAAYKGGKITSWDAAGMNFTFSEFLSKNTFTADRKFTTVLTADNNCSVEAYKGKIAMNYLISSSFHAVGKASGSDVVTSLKFWGVMSTFTKNYKEGRLSLGDVQSEAAAQLRCVKNK